MSTYSLSKILLLVFFAFTANNAFAFFPEEILPKKADEERARKLFLEIKCPVCAGQVIGNSDTEISRELRKLVRNEILLGKSDKQIKSDLARDYGSDIIITPSLKSENLALWFLPAIFGIFTLLFILRIKL